MKKILLAISIFFYANSTQAQVVSTFAGSTEGYLDGTGTAAQFFVPYSLVTDASGNVYVGEENKLRKITPAGVVTTLAGSTYGTANGTGTAAQFDELRGIAIDASGNIYGADFNNHRIRKITPAGVVSTFAGSSQGFSNATGTSAKFSEPSGVAIDALGNVYVADTNNHRIRKITPAGVVTTFAGSSDGFSNATGTSAKFSSPVGIAIDKSGNLYVADLGNKRIRKITSTGVVSTFAGSGTIGSLDGIGSVAQFSFYINGLTVDAIGNVYVTEPFSHRIRKITAAGVVSTFIDNGQGSVDGSISVATFDFPQGITTDNSGNIYVSETGSHRIRKISDDPSLGLNQNNTSFSLCIYPNPSTDFLTIELEELNSNAELVIADVLGKTIHSQNINRKITTVNTSNFRKGLYFLTIQKEGGKTTKKLIVE